MLKYSLIRNLQKMEFKEQVGMAKLNAYETDNSDFQNQKQSSPVIIELAPIHLCEEGTERQKMREIFVE